MLVERFAQAEQFAEIVVGVNPQTSAGEGLERALLDETALRARPAYCQLEGSVRDALRGLRTSASQTVPSGVARRGNGASAVRTARWEPARRVRGSRQIETDHRAHGLASCASEARCERGNTDGDDGTLSRTPDETLGTLWRTIVTVGCSKMAV